MFCFVEQLCIPDCGEVAKKAEAEAVFKELLASCTSRLARRMFPSSCMPICKTLDCGVDDILEFTTEIEQ